MLAHANHAQFLIRKLWAEFIASPIPQATLDGAVAAYKDSRLPAQAADPRRSSMHPLIFESIDEPNLIKPPIVYIVGVLRQLDAPLKHNHMQGAMNTMQQRIYRPPNVAGWEGGMSWLNTNTVQGRFDLVVRAQFLKYSQLLRRGARPRSNYPADASARRAQALFDRAYAAANRPWISDGDARRRSSKYAAHPHRRTTAAAVRRQRFYAVQALILGGPDGQVM